MLVIRARVKGALVARGTSSIVRAVVAAAPRARAQLSDAAQEGWQRDEQDAPIASNELSLNWTMGGLLASQNLGSDLRDECYHVTAGTSVSDAARAMLEAGCGALIVEDGRTREMIGHLRKVGCLNDCLKGLLCHA